MGYTPAISDSESLPQTRHPHQPRLPANTTYARATQHIAVYCSVLHDIAPGSSLILVLLAYQ